MAKRAMGRMSRMRFLAMGITVVLLISGCTDTREDADVPSEEVAGGESGIESARDVADVEIGPVPPSQWARMRAAEMIRPECPIQRRSQLRSVSVNYVDFEGDVRRGQLVVNADVARSVARVFARLFVERFPIRRMRSVEAYGGDTARSLRADNTSAFNCRRADQINAPFAESPHANGRAVDINPRENPWMDLRCDCWFPTASTKARIAGPGVIVRGGLVWRLFRREGWIWQNIDVPDYMHFDTGYPSGPFEDGRATDG